MQLGRHCFVLAYELQATRIGRPRPSVVGGGHGCACSHRRRLRNCGSSDSMLASAVVPVRGRPLMSTGPRTGSSSISGCVAYQASTSRRFTRRRRRSSTTPASVGRAQVGVAFEALEQHVEPVAEVAGAEVVETGRLARRRPAASSAIGVAVALTSAPHPVGIEVLGRRAGTRRASRPRTVR